MSVYIYQHHRSLVIASLKATARSSASVINIRYRTPTHCAYNRTPQTTQTRYLANTAIPRTSRAVDTRCITPTSILQKPYSKLTPHALQPELDILQLFPRGFPLLKHIQQLLHLVPQLLLHKLFFEQSTHSPRQEERVLVRHTGTHVLISAHSELIHILLVVFCTGDRYVYSSQYGSCTLTALCRRNG
jgi:hypothetical protein